ncbi:MAG: hypothetical protein ACXWQO_00405 [Bdellovibrionota bacterium]
MPRIEGWLPTLANREVYTIPSWAAHLGARRLEAAEALVGRDEARRIARKEGAYELEDSLADSLRLEGLDISSKGEFPALSPSNWLRSSALGAAPLEEQRKRFARDGLVLKGIMLSHASRKSLLQFLHTVSCTELEDVWELLAIADHFFQADRHELLVERDSQ